MRPMFEKIQDLFWWKCNYEDEGGNGKIFVIILSVYVVVT